MRGTMRRSTRWIKPVREPTCVAFPTSCPSPRRHPRWPADRPPCARGRRTDTTAPMRRRPCRGIASHSPRARRRSRSRRAPPMDGRSPRRMRSEPRARPDIGRMRSSSVRAGMCGRRRTGQSRSRGCRVRSRVAFWGLGVPAYSLSRASPFRSNATDRRPAAGRATISKTCSIGAPVRAAVVTTAPIPIHLRPDRASRRLRTDAGGPRQEQFLVLL
jgi:hypothetical protein